MALYYTQQAIVIGSNYAGSAGTVNSQIDARRMKNFLKEKFQYEVQLLENPNIE